ncbi:Hypothetical predicted protein [Olea europaea subsp. europaea]|uniref:Uncharacterized protein n=1 Tax=Olea europaea subsp. europaea TaxID=158383 RepID=A0A8S0TL02_OLEEU|nr:Hypothetical predicted protein [Olea europaea subsp. europaea]
MGFFLRPAPFGLLQSHSMEQRQWAAAAAAAVVNCGIGREPPVESWGRKKRSIGGGGTANSKKDGKQQLQQQIGKQLGDDMTLSREIVVLDLKEKATTGGESGAAADGQQSATDDLISSGDGFAQKSPLRSAAHQRSLAASNQQLDSESSSLLSGGGADGADSSSLTAGPNMHCLSSQSLLLVICSIGFFFVAYVCLVAYFFSRRDTKISVIKHQYH